MFCRHSCASPSWAQTAATTANVDALEEIIVTAERRTAGRQKISISMMAIFGDKGSEQGQNGIRDILKNTPGVVMVATARASAVAIRGLGSDLPPQAGDAPTISAAPAPCAIYFT